MGMGFLSSFIIQGRIYDFSSARSILDRMCDCDGRELADCANNFAKSCNEGVRGLYWIAQRCPRCPQKLPQQFRKHRHVCARVCPRSGEWQKEAEDQTRDSGSEEHDDIAAAIARQTHRRPSICETRNRIWKDVA